MKQGHGRQPFAAVWKGGVVVRKGGGVVVKAQIGVVNVVGKVQIGGTVFVGGVVSIQSLPPQFIFITQPLHSFSGTEITENR